VKLIIMAGDALLDTALYDSDLDEDQALMRSLRRSATTVTMESTL